MTTPIPPSPITRSTRYFPPTRSPTAGRSTPSSSSVVNDPRVVVVVLGAPATRGIVARGSRRLQGRGNIASMRADDAERVRALRRRRPCVRTALELRVDLEGAFPRSDDDRGLAAADLEATQPSELDAADVLVRLDRQL